MRPSSVSRQLEGQFLQFHLTHGSNEFSYGSNRFVHHCLLFSIEFELEDLLDTLLAEYTRYADIKAFYTELAVQVGASRKNALLVFEDRLSHGDCRRSRAVECGTSLEQGNNFAACATGTLDHCFHNLFGFCLVLVLALEKFHDRNAVYAGITYERNHVVAVTAEGHGINILDRYAEFPGDEGYETCRIENTGLADNAVVRKTGDLLAESNHGVERVGDDDDERVRCILLDPLGNGLHDLGVGCDEVVTAHARFTGKACSNDNNVCALDIFVAVGAFQVYVK